MTLPSEVIPGLFVGNMQEAQEWTRGPRLCVIEQGPQFPPAPQDGWVVIYNGRGADVAKLDEAAAWIQSKLTAADGTARVADVMVYCGGAMRSPLVAAWYLHKYQGYSWEAAYALVCEKNPRTQRRDAWVPAEARGLAPTGAGAP